VAVHIFRLARLDTHFQKPDMVVFEEDFVVLGSRVDRFQGVRPMPNHACLALRPGTGYKSKGDSDKESGDGRKLALVHDLPPGCCRELTFRPWSSGPTALYIELGTWRILGVSLRENFCG
jgi:hypothetical protein